MSRLSFFVYLLSLSSIALRTAAIDSDEIEHAIPGYALMPVYDEEYLQKEWAEMKLSAKEPEQGPASAPTNQSFSLASSIDTTSQTPLDKRSGSIMKGPINVYLLFYGNEWKSDVMFKIQNFVTTLDKTDYFGILKSYTDKDGAVKGPVKLKQTIWSSYEIGQSFNDGVMANHLLDSVFPNSDENGIYVILTDNQVNVSLGNFYFCQQFCGYHSMRYRNGITKKYAFVGDASTCGQCSPTRDSPNLDKAADATTSILAHEIFETITNPDPTRPAYIGSDGKENADKCNFFYGDNNPRDRNNQRYNHIGGYLKYRV